MDSAYQILAESKKKQIRIFARLADGRCICPVVRELFADYSGTTPDGAPAWSVCFDESDILFRQGDIAELREITQTQLYNRLAKQNELENADKLFPLQPDVADEYIYDKEASLEKLIRVAYAMGGRTLLRLKSGKTVRCDYVDKVDVYNKDAGKIDMGIVERTGDSPFFNIVLLDDIKNMTCLSELYFVGNHTMFTGEAGVNESEPVKLNRAIRCFELAASEGQVDAMFALADIYERGHIGIPKDRKKALHYLLLAAGGGQKKAFRLLGDHYRYQWKKGRLKVSPKKARQKRAFEYYSIGAQMGEPYALCELGDFYADGIAVRADTANAYALYMRAFHATESDRDDDCAPYIQLRMGKCFLYGWGVEADLAEAKKKLDSAYDLAKYQAEMHNDGRACRCLKQIEAARKEWARQSGE